MILFIRAMLSKLKTQVGNFTYAQKALLGSFIFLSIYSVSLLAFATTYLSPGFTLDPAGGPGSYAVTPSLTYGGTVTSGHDGEVLYVDGSGNLVSDDIFTRNSSNGDTIIGKHIDANNDISLFIGDAGSPIGQIAALQKENTLNNTQAFVGAIDGTFATFSDVVAMMIATDEDTGVYAASVADPIGRATLYSSNATSNLASFEANGGSGFVQIRNFDTVGQYSSEINLGVSGNDITWDADTTDDLSDFFIQAQNISGAGIDGTLIGHIDSVTSDHTLSSWGDFTGQGGQAFQAITSVGSGNIEVGHTVSPANGYQIQYADIGGTTTIAHLSLDGSENILGFDTNANDTIEYGLQQSEDIKGLGLVSGSFNFYEDTSSDLVAISGSGDGTPSGGSPATSIMLTKSTVTDDIAAFQTSYDPGFPEVNAIGQVVNGTNMSALILNSTDSDLLFSADSFATSSGFTANSIASYMFRNDGTTQWMTGISDGIYEIKDYTNSKDYFKVDMTSGLYQLGDIDSALNDTLFTVNDTNKTITGTSVISGTKNTSMKVGSIPGLSLPGSAFDYSDSVTGQSSSIGVGDFSGIGGNSNTGYMTWYTGATSAQSLLTTNNGGIIGLFTDGTGATYDNEFHLGSTGFTLSSNSGSYTFPLGDGTTDYVLATDGSGQLFWQDPTLIPSDQTLKSNIAPSTYGLSTLLQLNPVSYILNANNKQQIGFIAQEVEPLIPELIGEIAGGKKGLAYGQLSAVIVKAIQELDLKIKPLEDLMTENNSFAQILRTFLASATNGVTDLFSNKIHTKEICVGDDNGETCLTRSQLNNLMQSNSSTGGGSGSSTTSGTSGDATTGGTLTSGTSGTTTTDTSGSSGTSDTTVTTGDSTSTTTAGENNSSTTTTTTSTGDGTTSGISTTGDVTSGDTTTDTGGSGTTDTTTSSTTTGDGTGTTGV